MTFYCFIYALFVFIVTAIVVIKSRRQFNRSVQIMLIGIIGVITILMFPMYRVTYDSITSILFSLIYALRALTGCQSVDVSHKIAIEGWLYYGYYFLLYVAFIIAPIFTTGFLVSVFGNIGDKIHYYLLGGKKIHVFSDLNESAVYLCESMNNKKDSFVFCNTKLSAKDKDTELVKRARKIGAVILDRSEQIIKIYKKDISFYQISKDKDYNINSTLSLIDKYKTSKNKNINIFTFSSGITTDLLLDSIDKGQIRVKLIDEIKYSCYTLLDQAPLFENIRNNKISALIVGCDYTGMEMLKSIIWCGQIDDIELEINVIDKAANEKNKQLKLQCPELFSDEYKINFIQTDVKNVDFEDVLDKHCKNTTYVVVATGDDKINIDTAVYLRKYFLRKDVSHFFNKPTIYLRVRNALKNKQVDMLHNNRMESYDLHAFGSMDKTFVAENLFGTTLERKSKCVHLAYCDSLDGTCDEKNKALESYYDKEYNQRSSFASALHIKYKMFSCGIKNISGQEISVSQAKEFEYMLCDKNVVEKIAKLEHKRWSAFMRTEGYVRASIDNVNTYFSMGNNKHVHYLAKLHPTLVEWDELDTVSEEISKIIGRKMDFKQYDYDIVKKIPDILYKSNNDI